MLSIHRCGKVYICCNSVSTVKELLCRRGPNIKYTVRKSTLPSNPFGRRLRVDDDGSLTTPEAAAVPTTSASTSTMQPVGMQPSVVVSFPLQAEVHSAPPQPQQGTVDETPVAQHVRPLHREWDSSTTGGEGIEAEREEEESDHEDAEQAAEQEYRDMPTKADLFGSDAPSGDSQDTKPREVTQSSQREDTESSMGSPRISRARKRMASRMERLWGPA